MDFLLVLLLIVVIILIVSFRGRMMERIDLLEEELRRVRKDLHATPPAAPAPPPTTPPVPAKAPQESEPFQRPQPTPVQRPEPAPIPDKKPAPVFQPPAELTQPHTFQPIAPAKPVIRKPGFFERHPDLEKFIGENLVSKIGIAILVFAIGFFVKYAIDNDWIGPAGRVGVGILCGGILVGIAHFLRNNYKAFSSVLVGGGLAIFYFTIALAYHQYNLFSQSVSFIIMLVITAFAVILSTLYDRQELAIIALVGGFVTPFLVSNGTGNYQVLFSYLLILNTGLLVIAYRKAWRLLNLLAFGLTAILFAAWLFTLPYNEPQTTFRGGFLFATAFYILFFLLNILHNIRENKKFIASDFGILLANTCLYFGLGLYMIAAMGFTKYQGLFSACMGIFNLLTSYFLFRKKKVDANILYLLIGITLTFISLTAPIQLHGHYITLFWASESVLLYWLSRKSGIRIIGVSSLIVWVAMLISLGMDWINVYGFSNRPLPVIFNKGLMTTLYASACCYILFLLRKKAPTEGRSIIMVNTSIIVGSLLLFAGGAFEIYHQFVYYYPNTNLDFLYLALYGFCWSSVITYAGSKWHWFNHYGYATALLGMSLLVYLLMAPEVYDIQTVLMTTGMERHFLAHWGAALLIALMIYRCIAWWKVDKINPAIPATAFTWIACILILVYLTAEVLLVVNNLFYGKAHPFTQISDVYIRAGLPILWGLSSFVFMWLGMRYKFKPLRIVSLVTFSVTLLKLFLFDIVNIPVAGKIAAFFCLGVLLLVVSFMYQRLKKIIIEDEEKKTV